jgi:hypothetical protein
MLKKSILLTICAVLLASCLPLQQPTVDVQSQVNTAVAQTMEANNRIAESVEQTVAAQQPVNTPTLEATATFEIVQIPTDTPFPTLTPRIFPTDPPAPAAVQQPYSCFVLTVKPAYGEEIKAGASFEIRWNVKNTGTRAWDSGVDVKYGSGVKMTKPERVEISNALAPGEIFKISLTGQAPKNTGVQQMTWVVEGVGCYANVVITVK